MESSNPSRAFSDPYQAGTGDLSGSHSDTTESVLPIVVSSLSRSVARVVERFTEVTRPETRNPPAETDFRVVSVADAVVGWQSGPLRLP